MKLRKLLAFAFVLVGMSVSAQQMPNIPVDTAVHMGKLPNGLTYYVRYNNYPEHRVNFYIAQRVGSLQEEESQRGLAHFLEHMAFNGTEHYKGNGVIDYTRTLGVDFGRDLNAFTGIDKTVYHINGVPSNRQSALDSCLLILKDWSNGLLLEDEEIDKERGVIHEEWRLRTGANSRMLERNLETLYPGSKYGKRMPIGLMSVVDGFKYNELRDYYHKWYRPDNQAIIVVGDVDVNYTINKIKELFGGIPAPGADAAQVVDEPVPDNNEAIVVVDKDKEQQYAIVEVYFKHDAMPKEMKSNMMYLIYDYAKSMIANMLNARLSEKAQEPDCPFLQAGGYDGSYIYSKTKDAFTLYALPKEGKTEEATQAVVAEALRVQKYGFTATEYQRAKDEYMSALEKAYNNRNKVNSDKYGTEYYMNYLENDPIPSIETEYQTMNQIVPMLKVEMINQMAQELVSKSDTNLVVMNLNTEKEGAVYPTPAALKGAVEAAQAEDLKPYVDNVKNEPIMSTMPKKGKIVKEEAGKFGSKVLTLSNGAKVVLKKTDYKADEVKMSAEAIGGESQYGQKDWVNTQVYDAVIEACGLGNFTNKELEKALAGKQASSSLSMSTYRDRVSGSSTVKDLETMFQLTYLNFTAINKDEKNVESLKKQYELMLKNKGLSPEGAFSDSVQYNLANHSWRDRPFELEDLQKVDVDRVLQIAKERTANAGAYTFYFVGNFDEATIKGYIEQYIASLPGKAVKKAAIKDVVSHPTGEVINQFTRKMETPKANAYMFWYNQKVPYSLENSILASAAGQVLSKIYLKKIREDASAAYSAGAAGRVRIEGNKALTMVIGVCPMKPEKSDLALQIMRDEAKNMANGVDAPTLDEIKTLMIKDAETSDKENGHWLSVLSMWYGEGKDIQTEYKNIVNGLTPAKVAAFMKNVVLVGDNLQVIMLPQE